MLKDYKKSKDERSSHNIETHIELGLSQLSKKMYNGAMIEFDKAMAINPKIVYPRLLEELEKVAAGGEFESALSIGMNLVKQKKDDFELVNRLGNYAQNMDDYKQAISLYKTALKINKNHKDAFYNLAAAEVKVDILNQDAQNAVAQFKDLKEYVLPSYIGGPEVIKSLEEKALSAKKAKVNKKIEELMTIRDKKASANELVEVKGIDAQIESLKKSAETVSPNDIVAALKQFTDSDPQNAPNHWYNLAIYALTNKKPDIAEMALDHIKAEDFPTAHVLKAINLEQKGNLEAGIEAMIQALAQNEFSRYGNVNLALMYRKAKKQFFSIKYFLKTASLLKKSNGEYSMIKIMQQADALYNSGDHKASLQLYKIAVTEKPMPEIMCRIGAIYKQLKQIDDAIFAFKDALKMDPGWEDATAQLKTIHDYYVTTGDEMFNERKYKPATEYFDKALTIIRTPQTLRKSAQAYHQLNDIKTEKKRLEEAEAMENTAKDAENERLRRALLIKGKQLIAAKQYQKAIEMIESAFAMKLDKNVYVQLATLYKKFKGKDSLAGLEKRWSDMVVQQDRLEAMAKEKERQELEKQAKQESPNTAEAKTEQTQT